MAPKAAPATKTGSNGPSPGGSKDASKTASKTGSGQPSRRNSKDIADAYPVEKKLVLSEEDQALMKATTEVLDKLIEKGKEAANEMQEADEYDLPLLKARGRRKSKDLEEQAMALLGPQLEKIFSMIDVSGDGQLDPGELKQAFELAGKPKSDAEIEEAIKELDEDGDGLINLEEFKKIAWSTSVKVEKSEPAAAVAAPPEAVAAA